ncbi:hypothetical protein [Dethiothermospora halolimnae]|uniref:hypothetical protein n=1 Tax=Dethiothermospora halolimnae TaxID=3114390 RepID=UPI003CCC1084
MSIYSKQSYLIRISDGNYYRFHLSGNNKLTYSLYDSTGHQKEVRNFGEYVLDFSIDIDTKDRIHIIFISKEGNLIYGIYSNKNWVKKELTKLNIKSNSYKYLTLKIINKTIHIFYSYCNFLNKNIWTIDHICNLKEKWQKRNVITLTPGQFMSPFYVENDKNENIHMVYKSKSYDEEDIYHIKFNSFIRKWDKSPKQISDSKNSNLHPYFFIDNKENAHLVWSILNNSNLKLVYKKLHYITNGKSKWQNISLPNFNGNNSHPIIFENQGTLKILFRQNNILKCLSSHDYGDNWNKEDISSNISIDNSNFIRYISNFTGDRMRAKVRHLYGNIEKKITLYNFFSQLPHTSNIESSDLHMGPFSQKNNNPSSPPDDFYPKDTFILNNVRNNINKNSTEENIDGYNNTTSVSFYTNDEPAYSSDDISIVDKFSNINDSNIKNFIENIESDLEGILLEHKNMELLKKQIYNSIYRNSKTLEESIFNNKNSLNEITNQLNTLEDLISQYNDKTVEFSTLLSQLKQQHSDEKLDLSNIQDYIDQMKKEIETNSKKNIIQRIINMFK